LTVFFGGVSVELWNSQVFGNFGGAVVVNNIDVAGQNAAG